MNRKKKIIIISIVAVVILIGVLLGVYIYNDNKNQYSKVTTTSKNETNKANDTEDLTEVEKEIVGVETADDSDNMEEEAFSDLYKEYLELSDEEKEKNEVIPRKQEVPFESLEDIKEKLNEGDTQKNEEKDKEENKIPERFNLAEKIDIKVENQGDYGLCWGFASLKSLETYLALNELGNYDFSEMHLDYIQSDLMYGYRELHTGGNFSEFKEYITVSGVVLESDVPYREHSEEEYSKFTDIRKITEVTETIEFPSLYKNEDSEHTDKEITDFRETVKKHIMKNGGLYASIVGTGAKNHYTDIENSEFMNHAVTIVGWDDNYSKDNFLSSTGKKPSKDGAYIALNSWGTFWNDGGYYYISYEDKFVETNLSGILSTSIESAYKINSIENETIKEYLVNNYEHIFIDYQGEDYITKNTISNITSLDLSNKDISSLDGIEIFENLSDLKLSNNKIKDVTPITKLKSLFLLDLSNNDITDISPLGDMKTKYLNIINLSNNKIKDVSALGNIKSEYGLDIDISKNPNVIGYEKLNNIYGLNISNCYVTDVNALSNFERLSSLKISNTPGIIGLDNLPESIYELDISECNIDNLSMIKNSISILNISNNKLSTLDGIQEFKNLYYLDVSGNKITDWSALDNIDREMPEQNEEYYEYYNTISIVAQNCDIEDITIFNNLKISAMLDLKDNNIKDVSAFKNNNIYSIDLSNNKNLVGLQGLKNVQTVFLNNCNIKDLEEILKLENVCDLSLEENELTDITEISSLKNISSLSLAGNKQLSGTISSEALSILNVSNCDLDNNFDFSKILNLGYLNIKGNTGISNIFDIIENTKASYITIIMDEMDYETLEKIDNEKNFYVQVTLVTLKYNLDNNETIDLSDNKIIKKALMKNMGRGKINLSNGHLNKNGYIIDIDDITKECVEIDFSNWSLGFSGTKIKIIFNIDEAEDTNINTNTNNTDNNNSTNSDTDFKENTFFNLNTENTINTNIINITNKNLTENM